MDMLLGRSCQTVVDDFPAVHVLRRCYVIELALLSLYAGPRVARHRLVLRPVANPFRSTDGCSKRPFSKYCHYRMSLNEMAGGIFIQYYSLTLILRRYIDRADVRFSHFRLTSWDWCNFDGTPWNHLQVIEWTSWSTKISNKGVRNNR